MFENKAFMPKRRTKVLVTFIEWNNDFDIVEFWEVDIDELTQKDLQKIKDIENRDISTFINI